MSKLPVRASRISTVITNPQKHRRTDDDRNFVVVANSVTEPDRRVELHLTDKEVEKLWYEMEHYLRNGKPELTTIVSFDT